ncbi:PSD1 and planctomycete cytochrome C domain-containing protein [Rosistilla carotiformis]|uniref:PSD1 and planctomycete cytochrome C domain-containing protein n=1 Tax=Rosistilla carotiformis TaxID=2528017 RepID=UPI001E5E9555|nr:PSD1 and planctomycete cytochrome C domain-containing protein [Rosistilla carotiformis]
MNLSVAEDRLAADRFIPQHAFGKNAPGDLSSGFAAPWQLSQIRPAKFADAVEPSHSNGSQPNVVIAGTNQRNNPLRRELSRTYAEDQLFVGFRFLYEPAKLDQGIDPEFFVLWLDRTQGSDQAVHSIGVPNIGIHMADRGPSRGKNVFMVRFGAGQVAWSRTEMEPGKTYRVIAKLSKQTAGTRNGYSQIQLWVDPQSDDAEQPILSLSNQDGIHQFRWIGFATGGKTEREDRIRVDDVVLSRSWQDAFTFLSDSTDPSSLHHAMNPPAVTWDHPIDFTTDIFPILRDRCFGCHAGDYPDSGFRLDVRNELLGFSTGHVLAIPGESHSSPLLKALTTKSEAERMPPDEAPLADMEVAKIRAWIDQGLKWDDALLPTPKIESDHWAFLPIKRPAVPVRSTGPVDDETTGSRHPIDVFIHARQKEIGVQPTAPADRRTLVRRLYLDMLGLPPTVAQTEAFVNDTSADAYEKLVDALLLSPHYGERMARYWLDLARWGESQGYQHDIPRPFAWRYRDYVIDAFNSDKSYAQFLREQIAGDELQPYTDDALIATGFLAAARISGNQLDKLQQRTDVMMDIVDNTTSALLGLTMECAQCHNHKFEPIMQRDYYALMAFFANGQLGNYKLRDTPSVPADEIQNWFTSDSYRFYLSEAKKRKVVPGDYPVHTWGFYSPRTGDKQVQHLPVVNRSPLPYSPDFLSEKTTHVLIRGDVRSPGLRVEPAWPAVLGETPSQLLPTPRQALADWLSSAQNPLVARVWVNRLWQSHFGRGLVETPSDFGTHGAAPTHPLLLDWLASELIDNDWSTKHIHRLIVTSATYRQSGVSVAANLELDLDNKTLWRWPQRRMEAEVIRDSILVATGELNRLVGGPSVAPQRDEQALRRTIYLSQRRSQMPDVMTMFDAPDGVRSCSRREVSTVALQPLYLLNSPFVVKRAEQLARIVRDQAGDDPEAQIHVVFEQTLGRAPMAAEVRLAMGLLERSDTDSGVGGADGNVSPELIRLCHSMMNLNEFVYIP